MQKSLKFERKLARSNLLKLLSGNKKEEKDLQRPIKLYIIPVAEGKIGTRVNKQQKKKQIKNKKENRTQLQSFCWKKLGML